MITTATLTQQLADRMRAGVVDAQMHALKVINWMATVILYTAMGVSYLHQVAYLITIANLHWDTPMQVVEGVSICAAAALVPLMVDCLMVLCVKMLAARAIRSSSKAAALVALLVPVGISATINGMAPAAHWLLKMLFIAPVAIIPISEGLKALAERIDLAAIGAAEADVAAQATPVVAAKPAPTAAQIAGRQRAAATRAANKAAAAAAQAAAAAAPAVQAATPVHVLAPRPRRSSGPSLGRREVKSPLTGVVLASR